MKGNKKFILLLSGLLIIIVSSSSLVQSYSQRWIEINTREYDLVQDGKNEIISLMVLAEGDREGNIYWDDGHFWRLSVNQENNKETILYEEYITFAEIKFNVGYFSNKNKPSVLLIIENHVLIKAIEFTYSPIENQYASNVLFYFIKN